MSQGGGGFDRGVCFSTLVTWGGGVKFYATLKMQGVKFLNRKY